MIKIATIAMAFAFTASAAAPAFAAKNYNSTRSNISQKMTKKCGKDQVYNITTHKCVGKYKKN